MARSQAEWLRLEDVLVGRQFMRAVLVGVASMGTGLLAYGISRNLALASSVFLGVLIGGVVAWVRFNMRAIEQFKATPSLTPEEALERARVGYGRRSFRVGLVPLRAMAIVACGSIVVLLTSLWSTPLIRAVAFLMVALAMPSVGFALELLRAPGMASKGKPLEGGDTVRGWVVFLPTILLVGVVVLSVVAVGVAISSKDVGAARIGYIVIGAVLAVWGAVLWVSGGRGLPPNRGSSELAFSYRRVAALCFVSVLALVIAWAWGL